MIVYISDEDDAGIRSYALEEDEDHTQAVEVDEETLARWDASMEQFVEAQDEMELRYNNARQDILQNKESAELLEALQENV